MPPSTAEDVLFQRFGRFVGAGTVVFRAGDPGEFMVVIQRGTFLLSRVVRGVEIPTEELGKGAFFGELALLRGTAHRTTATAVTDCKVLAIDRPTFEAMVRTNSDLARRVVHRLAVRLARAGEVLGELEGTTGPARLLGALALYCGDLPGGRSFPAAPADLGRLAQASKEEIVRSLRALYNAGVIVNEGGRARVADAASLRRLREFFALREALGPLPGALAAAFRPSPAS